MAGKDSGLLSGLGGILGFGGTPKKKIANGTMVRSSVTGEYEPSYAIRTDAAGKSYDVTESDYNDMISKSKLDGTNYGSFKINEPLSGSNGIGFSDFATGAKMFGDIAGGVAGLGTIYLADRNDKRQKERDEYLKSRDAMSDAKINRLQANYDATV